MLELNSITFDNLGRKLLSVSFIKKVFLGERKEARQFLLLETFKSRPNRWVEFPSRKPVTIHLCMKLDALLIEKGEV